MASVVFLDVSVALAFAAAGGGEPAPRPPLSLSLVSQPGRLPPLRWPTPRRHLSYPLCWIRPQLPDCRRRRLRRRKSHRPRRQRRAGSRAGFDLPADRHADPGLLADRHTEDNPDGNDTTTAGSQAHSHRPVNLNVAAHRGADANDRAGSTR